MSQKLSFCAQILAKSFNFQSKNLFFFRNWFSVAYQKILEDFRVIFLIREQYFSQVTAVVTQGWLVPGTSSRYFSGSKLRVFRVKKSE